MDSTEVFQDTYNEYLFKKADAFNIPIMGTFELTPICNMKCKMCYIQQELSCVNQKGGLKGLDFWKRIFDEAIEEGMLFCLLTGGEIFTYPYFKELYEYLCTKGIHIVLNTNATLLDEETVAWLAEHRPRRLNISLYGASADTYENLCKNRGGFERVLKAFELLNKYGIDYKVYGVLVPSNINDYEGIKKICNHFRTYLSLSLASDIIPEYKYSFLQEDYNEILPNVREELNEYVLNECDAPIIIVGSRGSMSEHIGDYSLMGAYYYERNIMAVYERLEEVGE